MPKMKLKGDVICECGFIMMVLSPSLLRCANPNCKNKNKKFKIPEIEVIEVVESSFCHAIIFINNEKVLCKKTINHDGNHSGIFDDDKKVSWNFSVFETDGTITMSHWNHRVIKKVYDNGEIRLGIHEVFYNDDGSIYGYTEDPTEASIVNVDESTLLDDLREYIQWMLNCFDKPILIDGEVEFKHDPIEDQIDELMRSDNPEDVIRLLEELENKLDDNHN